MLSVGVSICAALAVGEAWCRALSKTSPEGYVPASNPRLIYELQPGIVMGKAEGRISSQGLSDRVYAERKPPGVFRIAVVSDSVGFGYHLPSTRMSYPSEMARLLNADSPGRFEVINFSVPGYNTAQELEVIRTKVLRFHPDVVIVGFTPNDLGLPNWVQPAIRPWNFLLHRSFLANRALRAVDGRFPKSAAWIAFKKDFLGLFYGESIYGWPGLTTAVPEAIVPEEVPPQYLPIVGRENWPRFQRAIAETLAAASIPFVSTGLYDDVAGDDWVAGQTRAAGVEYVYPFYRPLIAIARRQGIPPEAHYIPHDGHLNVAGSRAVARLLVDYLRERNLVPRPLAVSAPLAREK